MPPETPPQQNVLALMTKMANAPVAGLERRQELPLTPDWSRLAPNRPLGPGDATYVPRPVDTPRIPDWILTGRSPVLVVGPVGVGKSTELAFAAQALKDSRIACLVPLDRYANMRTLTTEQALLRIAGRLASIAVKALRLKLTPELLDELDLKGVLDAGVAPKVTSIFSQRSAEDYATLVIREVARRSTQGRITLLIDGLEKTPPEAARRVFDALEELPPEVELVVVVPWHAAYGPGAETVIAPGEKLVVIPPVEVDGLEGVAGLKFLRDVATSRLQLDDTTLAKARPSFLAPGGELDTCARFSGGVPRSFLQLLADAASYARITDGEDWPSSANVAQAVADQRESFRRLLTPGDDLALQLVDGKDGRDMALEQKLRLLSHGVLLERYENGKSVMRPHPIVKSLL